MGRIRRTFDLTFKIRVCEAIETQAKSISDICKQYQLQRQIVERWFQQYVRGELQARTGSMSKEAELEREVEKLQAKVGQLTMMVDALKKAERYKDPTRSDGSWIITPQSSDPPVKLAKPLALPPPPTITVRRDRR